MRNQQETALALSLALLTCTSAHAGIVSGFESGLSGWEYMGDVSVQVAAIGLAPTQGAQMAFISTMCDRDNPPSQGSCNTSTNEHPYSGTSSPPSAYAREFLGLPTSLAAFFNMMPSATQGNTGESGALKTRFYVPQAGVLSFDWNKIGSDPDSTYFSLWSDDPSDLDRTSDWLYSYETYTGSFSPSGVDLCSRYYTVTPNPNCHATHETGWSTKSIGIAEAGWYWLGFALGEIAEGSVPTVLAIDNVRVHVPEPGTMFLAFAALLGIAGTRRCTPETAALGAI